MQVKINSHNIIWPSILFVFLCAVVFFIQPISFLILSISLSIYLNNSDKYLNFSVPILMALLAMSLDFNGYYPDVVRYYSGFNGDLDFLLLKGKIYRYGIFEFIKLIGSNERTYTFISIYIIYFLQIKSTRNYRAYFLERTHSLNPLDRLLMLFCTVLTVPIVVFISFENSLAISIMTYAWSLRFSYKRSKIKIKIYTLYVISLIVHFSVLIPILLFSLSDNKYILNRGKISKLFVFICFVLFLIALTIIMNFEIRIGFSVVDYLFDKAYRYNNNEWSKLTFKELLNYSVYVILNMLVYLRVVKILPHKAFTYFAYAYFSFLIFFFFNRMVLIRYGGLMSIIFAPLLYIYIYSRVKRKTSQLLALFFVLLCFLSIQNLFILKKFNNGIYYEDNILFYTLYEYFNKDSIIPDKSELDKISIEARQRRK